MIDRVILAIEYHPGSGRYLVAFVFYLSISTTQHGEFFDYYGLVA
jgi:hypothetical protein